MPHPAPFHSAVNACQKPTLIEPITVRGAPIWAKGTLVAFHEDRFPDPQGLIAYAERLAGAIKLRPDSKIVVQRAWGDPQAVGCY